MPPKKHLDAPVSSASFLDLKAQLSKHEDDLSKSRERGQPSTITGGVSRGTNKKLPAWARQNKGLAQRQARDQVVYEDDPTTGRKDPQQVKQHLEKKAAIYDKIRKGKTGGLTEAQIDALLVDFDQRARSGSPSGSSSSTADSDDADDAPVAPLTHTQDPLVEFTDEFGRTRLIPRSEVPRGAPFRDPNAPEGVSHDMAHAPVQYVARVDDRVPKMGKEPAPGEGPDPSNVYYGDQTSFPVYEPDPAILAQRAATLAAAAAAPLVDHYSATGENRTRGAGFYAFSTDEQERRREMDELERARAETERKRREREVEGDRVKRERERERDERKRRIEDKRREVEERRAAKRAKAA
ncbi:hypothetical protein JCM3775_006209 [Rhodotorula graminis]|uniref:Uncharacterized protein n=1 Tax=Rhodotorula graminis (strain WP1) TaxID=578459 RepID=A0A194S1U7_RHOGW|nr:uncharacterized protein RHOBADRAFT_54372 [Rhodotorula graminis WP1]KPV74572.1 hypothetical protein RHOBADRAFT_54372 [Rhodotorula graminis WP1]